MGGLPPSEPSQAVIPPPTQGGCMGQELSLSRWLGGPRGEMHPREASRGVSPYSFPRVVLPRMAPPNLGSIAGRSSPTFTDFSDFLGRLFLVVGVVFTVDYLFTSMFFFQMMSSGGIASSIV